MKRLRDREKEGERGEKERERFVNVYHVCVCIYIQTPVAQFLHKTQTCSFAKY